MNSCTLFSQLSEEVWRLLGRAHRNHVVFGEDAITSIILDRIFTASTMNLVVEDSRPDEHVRGFDFELWIGTSTTGWYRYAVQAKKLDIGRQRYDKLAYMSSSVSQIDVLESYAVANRAFPIYCLYNHSEALVIPNCRSAVSITQLGCSVTPLSVVRDAIGVRGNRSFLALHSRRETIPWRCLVCCCDPSGGVSIQSHVGWGGLLKFRHENLPAYLDKRAKNGEEVIRMDLSNIFVGDDALRPGYVVVVDTGAGIGA